VLDVRSVLAQFKILGWGAHRRQLVRCLPSRSNMDGGNPSLIWTQKAGCWPIYRTAMPLSAPGVDYGQRAKTQSGGNFRIEKKLQQAPLGSPDATTIEQKLPYDSLNMSPSKHFGLYLIISPPPSVGGLDLDSRRSGCARLGGEVGPPLGVVVEEVAVLVVLVRRHRHAVRAAVRRAVDNIIYIFQMFRFRLD